MFKNRLVTKEFLFSFERNFSKEIIQSNERNKLLILWAVLLELFKSSINA